MTYSATGPSGAALPSWLTFSPVIKLLSGTAPVGTNSTTVVVTATKAAAVSLIAANVALELPL